MKARHVVESVSIEKQYNKEVAEKKSRAEDESQPQPSTSTGLSSAGQEKKLKQLPLLIPSTSIAKFDHNHPKQQLITEQIALMICTDLQPYSVVEDKGFNAVMKAAEPRYVMPTRKTFSQDVIPSLYDKTVKLVKSAVSNNSKGLAFTTDGWTSRSNLSYLSYTVHFLTENFMPKNYCLKVENVTDSHTAVKLADSLSKCVSEWTSQNSEHATSKETKVFVVTDNAANMQAALNKLPQYSPVSCFNHTMQLAVNDAVKSCSELHDTVTNSKKIVTFFKHSALNCQKLTKLQELMDLPKLKLKQDCPTRWNSTYDMLQRLVTLKAAVSAIAASTKQLSNLSADQWDLAAEYVKIFQPVTILTATMSASDYPTISMVIPELNKLKHTMAEDSSGSSSSG